MIVETRYTGRSGVASSMTETRVAFAANTLREATFFEGELSHPLLLRDAMAALYHVVVSDYQYRPRDRVEFFAWLARQDQKFLASLALSGAQSRQRMAVLEAELAELDAAKQRRMAPFHRARRSYFQHIFQSQYELELLLDPVITVHPDEISFEAFSRDESAYARLAAKHELFGRVGSMECGTTNIDFSLHLHTEFERLRTYRRTQFTIDPAGFGVASEDGAAVREKKIDLPDSWMRGFLQVHSAMSMGLTHVRLSPVDLFNVMRRLRRQKAKTSPRSLRFELEPGRPARIALEPWDHVVEADPALVYDGPQSQSVRVWGRDRLQILSRLLPVCRSVDVFLAGYGLPSFYVLDLGPLVFTLGLSGWTDNDWTGGATFDLLTRRLETTADELLQVYDALREERHATEHDLAKQTSLGVEKCRSAASQLCRAGRAMVDLGAGVYRHRDLLAEPFDAERAARVVRAAEEDSGPHAKAARRIFEQGEARLIARRPVETGFKLSGSVKGTDGRRVRPLLHVDTQGRIIEASCTCPLFKKSKLTQGPCEHILALRLTHISHLEKEDL